MTFSGRVLITDADGAAYYAELFSPEADAALALRAEHRRRSGVPFQERVSHWADACFGPESKLDRVERMHRFLEEALELAQACGCTRHEAEQLLNYVFSRPIGDPEQEVGGAETTLALLCTAWGFSKEAAANAAEREAWDRIVAIRAKSATKPLFSPLPGKAPSDG